MCDAKGADDQSNIDPDKWLGSNDHRWLRDQFSRRNGLAVFRRSERLPVADGNLAVNSWSGERKTCARKCGAKHNSDYGSKYVPISKTERHRHASRRALYRQSEYDTETSGLHCRRWTQCWSTDAWYLRDSRRDAQARMLGAARWPAPNRLQVAFGKPPNPSILEENRAGAFAVSLHNLITLAAGGQIVCAIRDRV